MVVCSRVGNDWGPADAWSMAPERADDRNQRSSLKRTCVFLGTYDHLRNARYPVHLTVLRKIFRRLYRALSIPTTMGSMGISAVEQQPPLGLLISEINIFR